MSKNTYWLTDGYGSKALVEGAEERDRWKPAGWSETDEPSGEDMVWLAHAEHGGRQRFAAAAVASWQALGWQPCAPPEPVDLLRDRALSDARPAIADVDSAPPKSAKATRATSGDKKE